MKRQRQILFIVIIILLKTFSYSNEFILPKSNIKKNSDFFSFKFSNNAVLNKSKPALISFTSVNDQKSKRFLRMGISGIILATAGIGLGAPSILLTVKLYQYYNSPIDADNIGEALGEALVIKPLAVLIMLACGVLVAASAIMLILGLIFIPVGFANYAKQIKGKKTSMFFDSSTDSLRFGLKFKI